MTENNIQTDEEKKSLRVEILEQVTNLATAGFGLVAALAWNEAIKALFSKLFPEPNGNVIASFIYALFITSLDVFITIHLGRITNVAKKRFSAGKK